MSNSIWKTPDQKPDNDNDIICLVGALPFAGYYEKFNASYVEHTTGENYTPDEIDRWCYLDDLIAQADKAERLEKENEAMREEFEVWHGNHECVLEDKKRLQKAVDLALAGLKETMAGCESYDADYVVCERTIKEIEQLIKG